MVPSGIIKSEDDFYNQMTQEDYYKRQFEDMLLENRSLLRELNNAREVMAIEKIDRGIKRKEIISHYIKKSKVSNLSKEL